MSPKQFLLIGGVVLAVVGILGFVGVVGPTVGQSPFGEMWWFDNVENWAHLVLGVVALVLAFIAPAKTQKKVVVLLGLVGIGTGVYSSAISQELFGANLQNPADTILHIVIGAWALVAAFKRQGSSPQASAQPNAGSVV